MTSKQPKDTPTLAILSALNRLHKAIRTRNAEVPEAVIVLGAQGLTRTQFKYGHFLASSWESGSTRAHEIVITGESLKRGALDTLGTLIHESAHSLAHARQIKDTSRQGRFHNKRFKEVATELGIELEYSKQIGWSPTKVPADTAKLYKEELKELTKALKAYKLPQLKPPAKRTTIRLETRSGRKLTVPISFYNDGDIVDLATGEVFEPLEDEDE